MSIEKKREYNSMEERTLGKRFSRTTRCVALTLVMLLLPFINYPVRTLHAADHLAASITHSCSLTSEVDVYYSVKMNTNDSFSNVRLHVEKQVFSGASTSFTWQSFDLTDYMIKDNSYIFCFSGVSAVEMNNLLRATVYADQGSTKCISEVDEFSVKQYLTDLITTHQNGSSDKDKKIRTLCVDLLNYGAAAQTFFGVNTSNLPNAKLTATQKGYASALPSSFSSCNSVRALNGASCTIDFFALGNSYDARVEAYMKFTRTPAANTVVEVTYKSVDGQNRKITIPQSAFRYDSSSKYYVASITGIAPADLKTPLTVVVKSGSGSISGTYTTSVESCMKDLYASASNELKALLRYSLALSNSSKAFFSGSASGSTPTPTKKATDTPTPTKKPTNTPTNKVTVTPVPTAIHTDGYVTYRECGAKGDGVTDDYDAIVATHEYANKNNLRVKADPGATYYIGHMDPKNPNGALIKTDTDWTGATFFIDDKKINWHYEKQKVKQKDDTYIEVDVVVMDDGHCYLFTVEPSKPLEHVYLNPSGGVYLGLDPRLSASTSATAARDFKNKTFSKDTTLLEGEFQETALYYLKTQSVRRWSRNGSAVSSDAIGKEQQEVVIVNKYDSTDAKNHPGKSRIDSMSPFQWDWDKIYIIDKCPIDETLLQITGGKFITNVNIVNTRTYVTRGLNIQRSNVLLKGVEHYLAGEYGQDGQLNEGGKAVYTTPKADPVSGEKKTVIYYPRTGAPYQGFFRLNHCAHVTLQNCVFSNHLRVYNNGDDTNSTAPYDFYAEYCVDLVIDNCHCAPTEDDLTGPADETGIMDKSRWGTTGTNYCKELTVQNHSSISRIDAHQGTYNMTVKDSTIGAWGVAAVGFGELRIDNSFIRSKEYLVKLRNDFGSAWFGDITITNTKWDIGTYYSAVLIYASYDPLYQYMYDTIKEDGMTYYSMLPENINISNLTIDAQKDKDGVFLRDNVPLYSPVMPKRKDANEKYIPIDDKYFNDPSMYKFPLRCTKNFNLSGLTIIKAKTAKYESTGVIAQRPSNDNHSEYYFKKYGLKINYKETPTIVTAD